MKYDADVPAKIAPWLAEALRREQAARVLSVTELARRAAMDRSHLAEIISGKWSPNLATLEKLCRSMRIKLSALFAEAERRRDESPVAVCYIVKDRRLLMLQRRDPDWIPTWGGPAGTADPNEKPEAAAVRRVAEDVGVEVVVEDVLGERDHPATGRHLVYFACSIVSGEASVVATDELLAVEWCDWPTVQERWAGVRGGVFPAVRAYLERAMTGAGEP